jgi:hypothetical protein
MNAVRRTINHICNASLNESVFLDRLKYAIVKPTHKKEDKTDVSNYRPILLLTTFSKIFEQVMYRRLSQHLNVNKVITPEQFCFHKNCNTETEIYSLTNNILKSLDEHNQAVGTSCNLAKAFDCVNHDILLDKLLYYGIQGTTLRWLRSYLVNSRQKVEIWHTELGKTSSNWETIKSGVPQGSILGPLLFLLYINNLPSGICIDCKLLLYAEDTSLLISGPDICDIQTQSMMVLDNLTNWFMKNGLSLNLKNQSNEIHFKLLKQGTLSDLIS